MDRFREQLVLHRNKHEHTDFDLLELCAPAPPRVQPRLHRDTRVSLVLQTYQSFQQGSHAIANRETSPRHLDFLGNEYNSRD